MRISSIALTLLLALFFSFASANAEPLADPSQAHPSEAAAMPSADSGEAARIIHADWELAVLPSGDLLAVLWLTPAEGYKTYGNDPGQTGLPTRATVTLTPAGQILPVLYPPGKQTPDLFEKDKTVNIYDDPTPLFVPLPKGLAKPFGLTATLSLLACTGKSCWPLRLETAVSSEDIPTPEPAENKPWWPQFLKLADAKRAQRPDTTGTADTAVSPPAEQAAGQAAEEAVGQVVPAAPIFSPRSITPDLEVRSLLKAIPLAFLAGFLLNLMPCVLPVACLKLSGLLAACAAEKERDRHHTIRRHNLFFSLGILVYFSLLALVLGLAGFAWGQLFQRPGVILGAAVVLFALGLSLFGVFHLPVIDLKSVHHGKNPKSQAFSTGFLATLLATPCSGPFLGGVLAWTLLQPVPVVVTVFFSIGLGMASPYMALAVMPTFVRFVPRPGAWLSHIEKLAAFLLMATCLYFLSILPEGLLFPALAALLVTALACYVAGVLATLSHGAATRWTVRILALAAVVGVCLWAVAPQEETTHWQEFDHAQFTSRLGKENLLLDFTADWCPTCKALEKTVLTPHEIARLKSKYQFQAIRVDLTRENPEAMALLRALGSASIPVAALFPKGADSSRPIVLRDLYTKIQLEAAMAEAFAHEKKH